MSGAAGEGEAEAEGIAIIGMAGRFPGAPDVRSLWRNICAGLDSIGRFTVEEREDGRRDAPGFVAARGILEGAEEFDAAFFGMKPREAALTDPQHRFFLETVWQAIEDAGHDPSTLAGQPVGVFAGCSMPTYLLHHVLQDRAAVERFTGTFQGGDYAMLVGALGDALATRVSYKLDLRGPSMTIQTACSTSLVAVAQAVQSLLLHQCDMAVAGGSSITFPQRRGYDAQEGGMAAPDGRCRPFDAAAGGTVFSHGCAAVVLRRLSDAREAGDPIYAVIRGAAVNNDGAAKAGFTAPSVEMQAEVVATAQAIAGVSPRSIGYVECHGTGTLLGDPIEVAALRQAFAEGGEADAAGFCALGSVKGNIGHLDAAAGVTGLIKAALCVERGMLPPTAHFRSPNPGLSLAGSPFFVQADLSAWPEPDRPRRAGVSALGVGGTNAHVVIEQAPPPAVTGPARPFEVLVLSARNEASLARMRAALAGHMREEPGLALGDVAHTLQVGRRAFPCRWAVAVGDRAAALAALDAGATAQTAEAVPRLIFLFPGQGSQYPGMGAALYHEEATFRAAFDRCADILQPKLGLDLREALYGAPDAEAVTHTLLAQPAIFAVEYALAQLWLGWGLRPAALAGHSVGELVAATVAGSITLEDALALVAERGRLMEAQPRGVMLAVRLPEAELRPLLGDGADLAAVNAPQLCVAAGPDEAMARLEARLAGRNVQARRLHTSHAFHSAMMDPVVLPLTALVSRMRLAPPTIPWVSGVTGTWITAEEATSPDYWGRHCRAEVRFAAAMATLAADGPAVLLEVGPGTTLVTLARQGAGRGMPAIASLPDAQGGEAALATIHAAAARLWTNGIVPDWAAMRQGAARRRVSLPGYAFERTRHWIDAPNAAATVEVVPTEVQPMPQDRAAQAQHLIREVIAELAGEALPDTAAGVSFLELGFDSLFLSQLSQVLLSRFGVRTSFRQLLRELGTLEALAAHVAPQLPEAPAPVAAVAPSAPAIMPAATLAAAPAALVAGAGLEGLLRAQVEAMSGLMLAQLDALKGPGTAALPAPVLAPVPVPVPAAIVPVPTPAPGPAPETEMDSRFRRFTAGGKPVSATLTAAQEGLVAELIGRNRTRMAGSRALTQRYRNVLADPRAAAGFRREWKDLVHPVVCARAEGAYIWDVDDNAYVDLVNGYGVTALGHSPDFVTDAVAAQLRRGFPIGPMADLAGPVAEAIAELTGHERVSFTCTGSEAVMAALRVARAVTGRKRVVAFAGAYHGGFDEVLLRGVRRGGEPRSMPAAAGITEEAVANMTILEFADPASLEWIRAHAGDLAAVLVEPVQSRHPGLQPRDFIRALREVTAAHGCALIMDEVVTGFRVHPGGAQALFGVRGDLATYGKVIGGGLPIGVLAGSARFMDALDGGSWTFGDDSGPEAEVTIFAGTFVRHPLALAAAQAVLAHLKAEGPALQARLEATTRSLTDQLDALFARRGLALRAERWGSMFFLNPAAEDRKATLLYPLLRERGVHIQENFPCFLTTAHGPKEVELVVRAFEGALEEVQRVGILAPQGPVAETPVALPLTEPQMEVWLAAQLGDEASCAFNEGVRIELEGALDAAALERALGAVLARHEALRARFAPTGETMAIAPPAPVTLPVEDLSTRATAEQDAVIETAMATAARQPFDLVGGPCLRAALLRRGPTRHTLLLGAHHIVCDGWSMNLVIEELATLLAAEAGGKEATLAAPLSFGRHARAAVPDAATEAHWLGRFRDPPPPLDLPADRPRPARKSFRGATLTTRVPASLARAVQAAGGRQGATLFATLLGLFQVLMGRLAQQDDVVVAVPMAGQSLVAEEGPLVGHCVNLLPVRGRWDATTTLAAHLAAVQEETALAREHQGFTLGTLVRRLDLPRTTGRLPLADVQFNLERMAQPGDRGGLALRASTIGKAFVNFDLFVNVIEQDDGLRIECDYNTDLFDETTVRRWLGHYEALLGALVQDAAQTVVSVPLLRPEERAAPTLRDTGPVRALPPESGLDASIKYWKDADPDRPAISFEAMDWSYAELDCQVELLVQQLRQRIAGREARIGILLERSPILVAALLAVLRAGFTYVPFDPRHPPVRVRRLAERAELSLLITDRPPPEGLDLPVLQPGQPSPPLFAGTDFSVTADEAAPAYLLFTSGSTGEPKGVEVGRRALDNLLLAMAERPGLGPQDRLVAVTTVTFDIAALELFLPLTVGARLVIAKQEDAVDGFALQQLMRDSGATMLQATPATWRLLLEAGFRSHPGFRMLCGGEPLPRDLANALLEGGGELWNMYGPTETTIWSSCGRVLPGDAPITIGEPIANTTLHVLDRHGQPVVPGVIGELWIGGEGVAAGYFRAPQLTAERFRPVPVGLGAGRFYGTGDLARWTPNGQLELLGRRDSQIKLRGFRIELSEVEASLSRLAGVQAAAVVLVGSGAEARLVAHVVLQPGQDWDPKRLREALRQWLPDYMVPAGWVQLDAMPLTPNRKLDRAALVAMKPEPVPAARPTAPPSLDPLEARIAAIVVEVLGLDAIGPADDLLALGADSLQLFQIAARAQRKGLPLAARHLMEHPTVGALARLIGSQVPTAEVPRLMQFKRAGRT